MGVVFRGFDPAIGRPVAVKIIHASEFATAEERAEIKLRFGREASAAGRLSHPGIVTIYQFAEADGLQYLVLELVEGLSLEQTLAGGPTPDRETAVGILARVADALDYAHGQGVIHRDVKPANILVKPDGTIKITDFGIARITTQTVTRTGFTMGTLGYMAPEQIMASRVTGAADQFSLAVIAYRMLGGRMPFLADTDFSLMHKIVSEEPPLLNAVNPSIPARAAEVIRRALAKRPEDRYASCTEFVESLAESLRPEEPAPPPAWKVALPFAPVLLLLLLGAIGAGVWLWRSPPRLPQSAAALDEVQVLSLLTAGKSDAWVGTMLQKHGIAFDPGKESLVRLRKAGAAESLLQNLNAAPRFLERSDHGEVLQSVGHAAELEKLGRHTEAAQELKNALARVPEDPAILLALGSVGTQGVVVPLPDPDSRQGVLAKILGEPINLLGVSAPGPTQIVVVYLDASGSVKIDQEPVAFERLSDRLREIFKSRSDRRLNLDSDPGVSFVEIGRVVQASRAAGIETVGFLPDNVASLLQAEAQKPAAKKVAPPKAAPPKVEPPKKVVTPPPPVKEPLIVGGAAQEGKLIRQVKPVFPQMAKQARVQGTVKLGVLLSEEGTVKTVSLISGHPFLVPAAIAAVKQWVYQPTVVNGQPVEVMTEVNVIFSLSQ